MGWELPDILFVIHPEDAPLNFESSFKGQQPEVHSCDLPYLWWAPLSRPSSPLRAAITHAESSAGHVSPGLARERQGKDNCPTDGHRDQQQAAGDPNEQITQKTSPY
jgi:hypothetical protein